MIVIGITGFARSGKDTLFKCLEKILEERGVNTERFALADELKLHLNDFTSKYLGVSSFTKDTHEKSVIRGLMVEYGRTQRHKTKGQYWTNLLNAKIKDSLFNNNVPIITDIRYNEYEKDEGAWLKDFWRGRLVHITRFDKGIEIKSPNEDESINIPRLKEIADYKLVWSSSDDFDYICSMVSEQLSDLIEEVSSLFKPQNV
jgi:hypothetical protein